MIRASLTRSLLAASVLLAAAPAPASAQVTEWFMFKEQVFDQQIDNTPAPVANDFFGGVVIYVTNPTDIGFGSLSGGGIPGSIPLTYDPDEVAWFAELEFPTAAAMNATLPSGAAYNVTVGGGVLGSLSQVVAMPPEVYPNTPFLTRSILSSVSTYPSGAPFPITWNYPGAPTAGSGNTWFDIENDSTGDIVFEQEVVGAATSALVPANTLGSTQSYNGYLTFTNSATNPPGPFGVIGISHHAVSLEFYIGTAAVKYCAAGTSASGCSATLSATGIPSASAGSGFVVSATNVEGNKDGLFFVGTSGRQANSWGTGSSFQCVIPPVKRFGLLPTNGGNGVCDGSKSQDFNSYWSLFPSKNPGPGTVAQAQLWYRDPFNTSNQTTSLSDAIEFTVNP